MFKTKLFRKLPWKRLSSLVQRRVVRNISLLDHTSCLRARFLFPLFLQQMYAWNGANTASSFSKIFWQVLMNLKLLQLNGCQNIAPCERAGFSLKLFRLQGSTYYMTWKNSHQKIWSAYLGSSFLTTRQSSVWTVQPPRVPHISIYLLWPIILFNYDRNSCIYPISFSWNRTDDLSITNLSI